MHFHLASNMLSHLVVKTPKFLDKPILSNKSLARLVTKLLRLNLSNESNLLRGQFSGF